MFRVALFSLLILTAACSTRTDTNPSEMMFDHYESRGLNR